MAPSPGPLIQTRVDYIPLLKLLEGFKDDPDPADGESRESSPLFTFQSATGAAPMAYPLPQPGEDLRLLQQDC